MRFIEAGLVLVLVCGAAGLMLACAPDLSWPIGVPAGVGLAAGLAMAWRLGRRE